MNAMHLIAGIFAYFVIGLFVVGYRSRKERDFELFFFGGGPYSLVLLLFWPILLAISFATDPLVRRDDSERKPIAHRTTPKPDLESAIGSVGKTIGDLRPTGWIVLGNERIAARAEHGFIKKGSSVTVVALQNGQVIVRAAEELSERTK